MSNSTGRREPIAALQRQVQRLDRRLLELNDISSQVAWLRLAAFLGGAALSIAAYYIVGNWLFWVLLAVSVVTFSVTVRLHRRMNRSIQHYGIWRQLKLEAIARIQLDWERLPPVQPGFSQPDHPFALDIDILGERSLYRLLDTTVSDGGSELVRTWLTLERPDVAAALRRQALVGALTPLILFRDKLTLAGLMSARRRRERWTGMRLLAWFETHTTGATVQQELPVLMILALVNIVLFVLNGLGVLPQLWIGSFLLYWLIMFVTLRSTGDVFEEAASLAGAMEQIRSVFEFLERYRYPTRTKAQNDLKDICRPFLDAAHKPSVQLRRLTRIMAAAGVAHNPMFWLLFNSVVPWDVFFAHQLGAAKKDLQQQMPVWLSAWYELEALSTLATFAYLNPGTVFPELDSAIRSERFFAGKQLGHPLIAADRRVCNDFTLHSPGEVVIVTGSNMAGKSSFLRTLGVNLCLAYAGAPVVAEQLQTTAFRLFSCIRVNDSVTDGFSYFYAEVRRLKALLNALDEPDTQPLFFLIDEIFRGTNNRERLIGSRSYIRALVARNGTGVIATHDLELVRLEDEFPQIHNYHFREEVKDGQMVFDYRLRPGPCPTTNALKIMQLAGLPVDDVSAKEMALSASPPLPKT